MGHVLRFFIPKPKSCWKHIAEFDSMFLVGEGIASEKHAALTADQSVQTGKKVKENGRLFYLNKSFLHIYLCSLNSKLTVTAARRNSLSLLLDCESATMQDTINIYPGWRKQWLFERTWCEHPFEHQVSGEHYVLDHTECKPKIQRTADHWLSQPGIANPHVA